MDVACNRCHAEYEFDDALISERGTTVFCTNCGLQFKIFPREHKGAPEEWTLTPLAPGVAPRTFRSLRELQRAILDGDVQEGDLLARGGQLPRALGTIAELEPLLKRPRSVPPPPVKQASGTRIGVATAPVKRTASGTVMGLAAPRLPQFGAPTPPPGSLPPVAEVAAAGAATPDQAAPPSADEPPSADDPDAIVPSSPPDSTAAPTPEPWQAPPTQTLRPKIQSVLSRAPVSAPSPEPASASAPSSSSRLRASLSHSAPPSTPGGRARPPYAPPPDSVPEPPVSRRSRFDSEPFSVSPGNRPRPRARGGWIVVSVLVGALAFVVTAARERVLALFGEDASAEAAPEVVSAERAVLAASELADEAWLAARIAPTAERASKVAALEARLLALKAALDEGEGRALGKTTTWAAERVHYLRMVGDVPAARAALAAAAGTPIVDPYLLAMLDLADQGAERPYASILRRLKDASNGERGRYRMRSAYIVALVEAGQLTLAQEDFARLSKNADAANAPLFGDLARYLEREQAALSAETKAGP